MVAMITDSRLEERLIAQRQASGADRFDEVWDGVYIMSPIPNSEHQNLVSRFVLVLGEILEWSGLGQVFPGVNLSSREKDWTSDYRGPDVAVFLRDGTAKDFGTHWCGAADFLIEIASPGDRTREKVPFYERLGVRELLIVDREPWSVELYRHQQGELRLVGRSTLAQSDVLQSEMVGLTFQLVPGQKRPQIEVIHVAGGRRWSV